VLLNSNAAALTNEMNTVLLRLRAQNLDAPNSDNKRPNQLRLAAKDKSDLEGMIKVEQGKGWQLLSRSYSLDEGHGATLVWKG